MKSYVSNYCFSDLFRCFYILKKQVPNHPDFYEDHKEPARYIMPRKIVDILSKYKLNFAPLFAYSADSENVNFGNQTVLELKIKCHQKGQST